MVLLMKRRKWVALLAAAIFAAVLFLPAIKAEASAYFYFKSPADGASAVAGEKMNIEFYAGVTRMDTSGNYVQLPVTIKVYKGKTYLYSEEYTYTKAAAYTVPFTPMATGTLTLRMYAKSGALDEEAQTLQDTIKIKVKKMPVNKVKSIKPEITVTRNDQKKAVITCTNSCGCGMEIYRATEKNGNYKLIKTTSEASFTDPAVKAGKEYYYKVKIRAEKGTKVYTSKFSRVEKLEKYVKSKDSSVLKIVLTNTDKGVKISWNKHSKAVRYLVSWSLAPDLVQHKSWDVGGDRLSTLDTSLKKGKTYIFAVSAWDANDKFLVMSDEISITRK